MTGERIAVRYRATPGAPARRVAVADLLAERGWEVDLRGDEPWPPGAPGVVLVCNNANWFPRLFGSLAVLPSHERPVVAVWHMEPLPQPDGIGVPWNGLTPRERAKALLRHRGATDPGTNWRRLRALLAQELVDVVAVAGQSGSRFLAEQGVEAVVAPYGWHENHGTDLGLDRDIDVLFLGTLDATRRRRALRRLEREGVPVVQTGTFRGPGTWGAQRSELLSRTRIVLNVSRRPGEGSQLRFVLGMGHGAAVVSEPIAEPAPFVPGEHYVSSPTSELADAVRGLLADEERRRALAVAGKQFVLAEVRLERSLDAVLAAIAQVRGQRPERLSR